nr:class II heat shock protein [Tanacetum cinerariifolium]
MSKVAEGEKGCCVLHKAGEGGRGKRVWLRQRKMRLRTYGSLSIRHLQSWSRVTDIPDSLLISFYISGLKMHLQRELLASKPMTLGYVFSLARIIEARFEAIAEKEQNIKEKADTPLSLPSEEASPMVKGPLDASEVTLLSLRSEYLNFKIQENGVEYVRALNVEPLEVIFAGPVHEVSSVIDDVFDIGESNVESMQVRGKIIEFSEDKGSVEKVLSATKLTQDGNSHSTYSPYHLVGKRKAEKGVVLCPRHQKDEEEKECWLRQRKTRLRSYWSLNIRPLQSWSRVLIMATLRSISRLCNRISSTKFNTKSFDSSSFIKATLNPKNCSSSRTTSRLPVELSALMTMLPLHSAVASSCLKSGLLIESHSWGLVPQVINLKWN